MAEDLLKILNLKKYFNTNYGTVKAVDDITFSVKEGETFGLVGESGSGKSTTGHLVVGMYAPTSGKILYKNKDISSLADKRPKEVRQEIQIVFQDPASSLNPSKYVKDVIAAQLRLKGIKDSYELEEKIARLLENVDLPPESYMYRKPRELGGGELQAIAIARALSTDPKLIILDEPTSALDVITQAKIVKLLLRIQEERKLTYIFITHDLAVAKNISKRIAVMYLGKIVELAESGELFKNPLHPYTMMLFSSIPVLTEEERRLKPEKVRSVGEIPSAISPPPGCRFHTRCPFVEEVCRSEEPKLEALSGNSSHIVACHLVGR
ncbi:MAG: ABC transporter ATP-binding protein [Candidatus Korarchaeum sp.]|nr:ABC transporter ATP-binding protein [Candidatus Korarchaeum sp.]